MPKRYHQAREVQVAVAMAASGALREAGSAHLALPSECFSSANGRTVLLYRDVLETFSWAQKRTSAEWWDVARQVMSGLALLASRGVYQNDILPRKLYSVDKQHFGEMMHNVMTTRNGTVVIVDFGSACFGGVHNLASCPLPREHVHHYWRTFEARGATLGSAEHWWWRSTNVGTSGPREVQLQAQADSKAAGVVVDELSCLWTATKTVWFASHAVQSRVSNVVVGTNAYSCVTCVRPLT